MDELVHHVIREISFDGDLGCDLSRLKHFISEFYAHAPMQSQSGQEVDDTFESFIWSLLILEPSVTVGLVPEGSAPVHIAEKRSDTKKVKQGKGKGRASLNSSQTSVLLDPLSEEESKSSTMLQLVERYGTGQLRIAVDPATSFTAITGSHIRSPKLSPMVYTVLQFITRSREHGMEMTSLGEATGYDQKAIHYLVQQLIQLDLIHKIPTTGRSRHTCVHKYFLQRSLFYAAVKAQNDSCIPSHSRADSEVKGEGKSTDSADLVESVTMATVPEPMSPLPLHPATIGNRQLIRTRVTKLLKSMPGNSCRSDKLTGAIGFPEITSRNQKRLFTSILRDFVKEGWLEKISSPNVKGDQSRCFRLTSAPQLSDAGQGDEGRSSSPLPNIAIEESNGPAGCTTPCEGSLDRPFAHLSINHQVLCLVEKSSVQGITMNELSVRLGNYDKRTLEQFLFRYERIVLPLHLADRNVIQLLETVKREHRHKYYTLPNYKAMLTAEGLDGSPVSVPKASNTIVESNVVGGFALYDQSQFYDTLSELDRFGDTFTLPTAQKGASRRSQKVKPGAFINPLGEDGRRVLGRPRNDWKGGKSSKKSVNSRKPAEGSLLEIAMRRKGRIENEEPELGNAIPGSTSAQGEVANKLQKPDLQQTEEGSKGKGKRKRHIQDNEPEGADDGPQNQSPRRSLEEASVGRPTKRKKQGQSLAPSIKQNSSISFESSLRQPLIDDTTTPYAQPPTISSEPPSKSSTWLDITKTLPETGASRSQGNLDAQIRESLMPIVAASSITSPPRVTHCLVPQDDLECCTFRDAARDSSAERHMSEVQRNDARETDPSTLPAPCGEITGVDTSSAFLNVTTPTALVNTRPDVTTEANIGSAGILVEPAQSNSKRQRSQSAERQTRSGDTVKRRRNESEKPSNQLVTVTSPDFGSQKSSFSAPRGLAINVSYMRREKEILRLLADAGGIMMGGLELGRRHMELVAELAKDGVPTSAPPGTLLDKRTLETLGNTMENRKAIRTLKTAVTNQEGNSRPISIFYLPTVTQEALQEFLRNLSAKAFPKSTISMPESETSPSQARPMPPDRSRLSAPELTQLSPLEIRTEFLLDRRISSQLFGFITGPLMRSRELHLFCTSQVLEQGSESTSPYIVSAPDAVVETRYFLLELPVAVYCCLVSLPYLPALEELLHTQEGRETKLKDLPEKIAAGLQTSRARSRAQLTRLLEILSALGVLTPLLEVTSPDISPSCIIIPLPNKPNKAITLKSANIFGGADSVGASDISYWQLNLFAPIYAFNQQDCPPLLGHVPTATTAEAVEYWALCKESALNPSFVLSDPHILQQAPYRGTSVLTPSQIRTSKNWNAEYTLTSRQISYLNQYVDHSTGSIPVSVNSDDPNDAFNVLCFAAAAPVATVRNHLQNKQKAVLMVLYQGNTAKDQAAPYSGQRRAELKRVPDAKRILAEKAKETKLRLEKEWDELLLSIHPQPLTEQEVGRMGLVRIRKSFMASGGAVPKERLRASIQDVLSTKHTPPVPSSPNKTARRPSSRGACTTTPPALPPSNVRAHHKQLEHTRQGGSDKGKQAIINLIAIQEPVPLKSRAQRRQEREVKEEQTQLPPSRRQRFAWNGDFDELAQDAAAVLGARCRSLGRMDWLPVKQVFPGLDPNGVRQRIMRLRDDPGTEAYMIRLEQAWYTLWREQRGGQELPDDNPGSTSDFDMVTHIAYLRSKIDKSLLRAGGRADPSREAEYDLPSTLQDLWKNLQVTRKPCTAQWDFLWNNIGEEPREKGLLREALVEDIKLEYPPVAEDAEPVAEAAVKMMLETPDKDYDADKAADLLESCGQVRIAKAIDSMQRQEVITRVISDLTKRAPGRSWRFQGWQSHAIQGPLSHELGYDAIALGEVLSEGADTEWSYLATGGEMAALIELVSDNEVIFSMDTSGPAARRPELDGNSKRVADDQLETSVLVRLRGARPIFNVTEVLPDTPPLPHDPPQLALVSAAHGTSGQVAGRKTACILQGGSSLIDCESCLRISEEEILRSLNNSTAEIVGRLLSIIKEAGQEGTTASQLKRKVGLQTIHQFVDILCDSSIPLVFWTGYVGMEPQLISSHHLHHWTVAVKDLESVRVIFPRRWLDIAGEIIPRVFSDGIRNVVGWVTLRPGITFQDLRLRLKPLFDKQESTALIQLLCDRAILDLVLDLEKSPQPENSRAKNTINRRLLALDDRESKSVSLKLNQKATSYWFAITGDSEGSISKIKVI